MEGSAGGLVGIVEGLEGSVGAFLDIMEVLEGSDVDCSNVLHIGLCSITIFHFIYHINLAISFKTSWCWRPHILQQATVMVCF